ncbi:MAG: DNA-3-methyladenine glycosylase [Crenarchaeota archaeon]|nr:MAG: DNA-3-methyladenine glycosylase [Thermoproteota archaeon]RDJ32828.1 MAG: DNA-3-methyladenine glycosylase [Thermoproteota archaeon]RDJ37997.1 MAG: DNA-3-methyladenine glycosylase [Thermoproteota archaeon]RDJ38339.1 MAG: DNA-3-methyladenine glycosylase [Thermoproteota archaeon]
MRPLPRKFYSDDTVDVAKNLLGKILVRQIGEKMFSGIITETEAYRFNDDPASHAFRGMTERNKAMFGEVGRAYVYFTYGMYYCVNAVARNDNYDAGAVLIRAIKPVKGLDLMIKNRKNKKIEELTNGPAKLTQALKITKKQYGVDLTKKSELFISDAQNDCKVFSSQRIGIRNGLDKKWNFKINL